MSNSEHSCELDSQGLCMHQVPILNHLTDKEMLEISRYIESRHFDKGEMIVMSGDESLGLLVINKGEVKISKLSSHGKEQILRILKAGDFMGELSLFHNYSITSNAEALIPTEVCRIKRSDMKHIINDFPNIALKLLEEVSERLETAESHIEQLGLYNVEQRVAKVILQLAEAKTNPQSHSVALTLSISKGNLASLIGTTNESLSRKLAVFEDQGFIKQTGQRSIQILDKDALENLSGI